MRSDPLTGEPYDFLNHVFNLIVPPSVNANQLNLTDKAVNEFLFDDLTEALPIPFRVSSDWSCPVLPRHDVYIKVDQLKLCQNLGINSPCQLKCEADANKLFYTLHIESHLAKDCSSKRFITPSEVFDNTFSNCIKTPLNDSSDELIFLIIQGLITGSTLQTMSERRIRHVLEIESWHTTQQCAFLARKRQYDWPSKSLLQHLTKLPLALIKPKKRTTSNHHQFCVSYHNCTNALVQQGLSQIHKQCYSLLNMALSFISVKVVCHLAFDKPLKNLLFYAIEETHPSFWKSENVGRGFLLLIDRLIHCLVNGMLLCYFEPSINLLGGSKVDNHVELARRVVWLRQHPVEVLVKGCNAYQFLHMPLGVPLRHILHHSFELVNSKEFQYDQIEQELCNKIASDHLFSCVLFLEEFFFAKTTVWQSNRLTAALNSFCEFCAKIIGNAEAELVYFWCLTTNFLDYKADRLQSLPDPLLMTCLETGGKGYITKVERFDVLAHLAQCYAENKSRDSLSMSNMLCLSALFTFLSYAHHDENEAVKQVASTKAQQLFQQAYNVNSSNVVCLVKLVAYLLATGQGTAALDICKEAYNMCKFDVGEKQRITFYKPECVLLDRFLRCEFDHTSTEISFLAQSFVIYFLLQAFLACDKLKEAEQILARLRQSEGCEPCNLLGYACLALEKYEEAYEVFQMIVVHNPENVAAQSSLELCTALLLSISIEPKNE